MKVKKYFAKDMREALRLVREELGPDAVILSNEKVRGGVEIACALDYEESILKNSRQEEQRRKAEAISLLVKNVETEPTASQKSEDSTLSTFSKLTQGLLGKDGVKLGKGKSKKIKQGDGGSGSAISAETRTLLSKSFMNNSAIAKVLPEALHKQMANEVPNRFDPPVDILLDSSVGRANEIIEADNASMESICAEIADLKHTLQQQINDVSWGSYSHQNPIQSKLFKHLHRLGLSSGVISQVVDQQKDLDNFEIAWRHSIAQLSRMILVDNKPELIQRTRAIALMGPTGVGKTTTICKLAARYTLEHGTDSLALVTTDHYRIGAQEQLSSLARILGVAVHTVPRNGDLNQLLNDLRHKQLVLIDTAGLIPSDKEWDEQRRCLQGAKNHVENYIVLPATSQHAVLESTINRYQEFVIKGAIVTKVDEAASLGEVISSVIEHDLAVNYITDGQQIPDDIHIAKSHSLVSQAVGMLKSTVKTDDKEMALLYGHLSNPSSYTSIRNTK